MGKRKDKEELEKDVHSSCSQSPILEDKTSPTSTAQIGLFKFLLYHFTKHIFHKNTIFDKITSHSKRE